MRSVLSSVLSLYALLMLSASPLIPQTGNADDGSPYGGPKVTPGSEPTLADNKQGGSLTGSVYVPVSCAVTDSGQTSRSCYYVSKNTSATLLSGVLVFTTTCP